MAHRLGFSDQCDGAFPAMTPSELIFAFLFMLLAGETFNRFDVRLKMPLTAVREASDA